MLNVICKTLITFLVIYAIIKLCSEFFGFLFNEPKDKKDVFVFIRVKNKEESIEYIVRCTILNYLNKYGGRTVPYIVIVDEGSVDKTEEISRRLCNDYDFLFYTSGDEYEEFKTSINRR